MVSHKSYCFDDILTNCIQNMRYKSVIAISNTCFGVLNNNSYMMANIIEIIDLARYILELNTSFVHQLNNPTNISIAAIRYNNLST